MVRQTALRIMTKVLPGNKIEVQLPPGSEGQQVDVFIVLPEKPTTPSFDILEFLEASHQRHGGRTAEDIDRQIRAERESWDN